jgi:hypothetical protein
MTDYTPTTDEVRAFFRVRYAIVFDKSPADAEFDRWLAAHDKEVLDKAIERVLTRCKDEQHNVYGYGHREVIPPCPMCLPAIAAIRGEGESE